MITFFFSKKSTNEKKTHDCRRPGDQPVEKAVGGDRESHGEDCGAGGDDAGHEDDQDVDGDVDEDDDNDVGVGAGYGESDQHNLLFHENPSQMGAVTSRLAPHIISQAMDDVNRQVLLLQCFCLQSI